MQIPQTLNVDTHIIYIFYISNFNASLLVGGFIMNSGNHHM